MRRVDWPDHTHELRAAKGCGDFGPRHERFLRHCGLWEGPIRTLPKSRGPPKSAEQDPDEPRELQLVLDPLDLRFHHRYVKKAIPLQIRPIFRAGWPEKKPFHGNWSYLEITLLSERISWTLDLGQDRFVGKFITCMGSMWHLVRIRIPISSIRPLPLVTIEDVMVPCRRGVSVGATRPRTS